MARDEGVYAFPHRSFQEYLAACHLADQPDFAEQLQALVCADPTWWREVCLLGVGKARQGGLGAAVNVVGVLLPEEPEDVAEPCDGAVAGRGAGGTGAGGAAPARESGRASGTMRPC